MEKPLAQAAGLGWQGKHTNLVGRDLGSWFFLGAIFTTLDLPKDAAGGQTIAASCTRLSGYLPDGGLSGTLPIGCAAVHFLSDDRT